MLLGYIVVGLLAGNIFPSIARSNLLIPIADIGVTLLMFSVGIEFSFHRLRRILKQAVWAAAAQLSICIFVFLALFQFFSMSFLESLYLAVALSLSSTAIIVKFLSERGEMDTVPGELSIGWLAVQDFSVILFIILLSSLSDIARLPVFSVTSLVWVILLSVIKSAVVLYIVIILGKHAIPKLLDLIAGLHNRELFLLSTIGLIFGFSALTYRMGFSAPLGAFRKHHKTTQYSRKSARYGTSLRYCFSFRSGWL
jgi:CPA2 family monovalent cation:H+ antiporter-2